MLSKEAQVGVLRIYDGECKRSLRTYYYAKYCSLYSRCYAIPGYTTTVSGQRIGKHIPAGKRSTSTISALSLGNRI
jgi:hypothetical protein